MATKTIKSRVLLKTGTISDWNIAAENSNFTPLPGEVCVYTDRYPVYKENGTEIDYYVPGIKIGNGSTNIRELPFVEDESISNSEVSRICGINITHGDSVKL